MINIRPQKGFQENFVKCPFDYVIAGGAAGLGKSFALLLDPLRYIHLKDFSAIIFRRQNKEVFAGGGLKSEAEPLYNRYGGVWRGYPYNHFKFPSGATIAFGHLQKESDKETYKGSQFTGIYLDELTAFTDTQERYMFSRNRSKCKIRPYVRATTNPQSDGFVKDKIKWYLDDDGYPIKERLGVMRYFMYVDDKPCTYASISDAISDNDVFFAKQKDDPKDILKTFTFLTGSIYDNKKLLETQKSYIGNLLMGTAKDVRQLLYGCWGGLESDDRLVLDSDIAFAFENKDLEIGEKYVTADVAFEGSDKFVLCLWRGWRLEKIKIIAKSTGLEVVEIIKEFAESYQVNMSNVMFDADGVGMALSGFLAGCMEFKANKKALGDANYNNIKSQAGFHLARKIKDAGVFVNLNMAKNGDLVKRISKELRALRRNEKSIDKVALIPKENKGAIKGMKSYLSNESPDILDCLIMRAAIDLKNSITFRYYQNFTIKNIVTGYAKNNNCYAIIRPLHYNFVNVIFVCVDSQKKDLYLYHQKSYNHANYNEIAKDLQSELQNVKRLYVYRDDDKQAYNGHAMLIKKAFSRFRVGGDIRLTTRKKILAKNVINELCGGVFKQDWSFAVSSDLGEAVSDFMSCLMDKDGNKIYDRNIGNISDAFETFVLNFFK